MRYQSRYRNIMSLARVTTFYNWRVEHLYRNGIFTNTKCFRNQIIWPGMLTCPFYLDLGQVLCPWPQMDLLSYPFHRVKKYLGQNQVLFRSFQNSILTKKIPALLFLENTYKIRTSFLAVLIEKTISFLCHILIE